MLIHTFITQINTLLYLFTDYNEALSPGTPSWYQRPKFEIWLMVLLQPFSVTIFF